MKKIEIPTGYIFMDEYENGELETLSIGDYGKENNVKADFLGYTDELTGVPNMECKPLTKKWVITLSTQYGCPMKCGFCDVPKIDFGGNANQKDLHDQLLNGINMFSEVNYSERLNIHFARMGEPLFNIDVLEFSKWIANNKREIENNVGVRFETIHPVVSTMLPDSLNTKDKYLNEWCRIKNEEFNGQAGLQFSINSTSEKQRDEMFNGKQTSLEELSKIADCLPKPVGRKYCLNFAYDSDFEVDGEKLRELFDPEKWMVKITPIHNNRACEENEYETENGYTSYRPYETPEENFKENGFDVLVFVPSNDEEDGCITCGNLVLSDSEVENEGEDVLNIKGIEK